MAKSGRRHHRPTEVPARRDSAPERPLLDRLLDTPHLAQAIPRLQPELLHRVIQVCGLEDCADIVALATPEQLATVLDLDLWRARTAGFDEALDPDRFGMWLEVLMQSGAAVAAQKLAGLDLNLVVTCFAQHLAVYDRAAVSPYTTTDGHEMMPTIGAAGGLTCEVGGYFLRATRASAWDAIVELLLFLDGEDPEYLDRLMRGCRRLSDAGREIDGLHDLLDDREQQMFDLASEREQRRETRGYVQPAQARAFLYTAKRLRLTDDSPPPPSSIVRAYFRSLEWTPDVDDADERERQDSSVSDDTGAAAIVELLRDAGVLTPQPRALLEAPTDHASPLVRIQTHMRFASDTDAAAYARRCDEFSYLANTLLAGGSLQSRAFTPREASDAAMAVCNLGLENWPRRWLMEGTRELPDRFLVDHDLVEVFQVGWTVLHDDVCMYAAQELIAVLDGLQCADRDIQKSLDELRLALARHCRDGVPWRARRALEAIVMLDATSWAALVGLIDECPVLHAALDAAHQSRVLAVDPSAFEFISENRQIGSVREFMRSLPDRLIS
jgi:hypothetical protein